MAAIDHTVIVFKNGEYLKEPDTYDEESGLLINNCPFDYGRDGDIDKVEIAYECFYDITDKIEWYRREEDALYKRAGISDISLYRLGFWTIKEAIKWRLHIMRRIGYRKEVGVCTLGDIKVYIYHDFLNSLYASFYWNSEDTYVVLGGYGHYKNPYTHFMARGYGDEFEEKMASEAYQWLCSDILEEIGDSIFCFCDLRDEWVIEMQKVFKYKS